MPEVHLLHQQGDPNDVRFQFEIIKQLAESVRVGNEITRDIQNTQMAILERLIKLEEQRVHEVVADVEKRVAIIESQHLVEKGAASKPTLVDQALKFWPVIAATAMVVWIIGRTLGFFHVPDPPQITGGH